MEKICPKWRWHSAASWGTGQIKIWRAQVLKTFHDVRIVETRRNAYLWIEIYQNVFKSPIKIVSVSNSIGFLNGIRELCLGMWESWKFQILKLRSLGIFIGILQYWKLKLWIFEIWNFETLKHWNLRNLEPWNHETLEPWNFWWCAYLWYMIE